MTSPRIFFKGAMAGLVIMVLVNLLAAHLLSDCGLPALLGRDPCADDIVRAGFPFVFLEEGGFAFRSIFNLSHLLLDVLFAVLIAAIGGLSAVRLFNQGGRK